MVKKNLYIYGASGHAKVAIDIAEKTGEFEIIGVIDDSPHKAGRKFMDYPVLGGKEAVGKIPVAGNLFFVGIGNNNIRSRICDELSNAGYELCSLIHPSVILGDDVEIGAGTVIMAGVVINSSTRIGRNSIINTGATIDHDCVIGDSVHISPGVNLAGDVRVGAQSWIGIGSCAIEGIRIGSNCMVGAGSVIIRNIPDSVKVVGNPANKILK